MDERQEEREKEGGELDEMTEERTDERTEETEERIEDLEVTGEACEEDEWCEEELECHSSAKRARLCATFTDAVVVVVTNTYIAPKLM